MEEGECDSSFSEEGEEEEGETGGKLEIAAVKENGEHKEEGGIILSAIQQELQKDVSWPSSDGGQLETKNRHMTGEEGGGEGEETEDKVPIDRLETLGHCDVIRSMLTNHHLRDLLLELDASPAPQQALRRAMNIPVFVEFADQCLRVCGLRDDDDKL